MKLDSTKVSKSLAAGAAVVAVSVFAQEPSQSPGSQQGEAAAIRSGGAGVTREPVPEVRLEKVTPLPVPSVTAPATVPQAGQGRVESVSGSNSGLSLESFEVRNRELGFTGDYLYGLGNVQVPLGYALGPILQVGNGSFTEATRENANYYGGTVSGSLGRVWFVDLTYSRGSSRGQLNNLGAILGDAGGAVLADLKTSYKLDEQFHQGYIRYAFPGLTGTRYSAYIRGGFTFATSTLDNVYAVDPVSGTFRSEALDYLGNLGAGIEYGLIRGDRTRVSLFVEGEGFGGLRQTDITESYSQSGLVVPLDGAASVQSTVYGGLGRAITRFRWVLDRKSRLRLNLDIGLQARYLINEFNSMPDFLNPVQPGYRVNVRADELLWGPYGRLGLSYSF